MQGALDGELDPGYCAIEPGELILDVCVRMGCPECMSSRGKDGKSCQGDSPMHRRYGRDPVYSTERKDGGSGGTRKKAERISRERQNDTITSLASRELVLASLGRLPRNHEAVVRLHNFIDSLCRVCAPLFAKIRLGGSRCVVPCFHSPSSLLVSHLYP